MLAAGKPEGRLVDWTVGRARRRSSTTDAYVLNSRSEENVCVAARARRDDVRRAYTICEIFNTEISVGFTLSKHELYEWFHAGCHARASKREAPRADAPPRDEVAARSVDHCSFMTMRRNRWKSFAFFMALVNMSAMLSAVRTNGTSSSKDSTMSRTK